MKKENKIIRTGKALTLFIVLVAVAAMAAVEVIYETSGTSRFSLTKENNIRKVTTTSQDYLYYEAYQENGSIDQYLVTNQNVRSYFLDAEGIEGSNAWSVRTGPKLGKVLWTKSENSTMMNLNQNHGFVVTGLEGCCAAMTGYRAYEIETGKLLMSFNNFSEDETVTQPWTLEIPNSTLRYRLLGLISADSTRDLDFVAPASGYNNVAILKYGNPYLRQKLQVDMKLAPDYAPSILEVVVEADPASPGSEKIEFNGSQITMWNIDGTMNPNDISGLVLKVTVDGGLGTQVIEIPVRQDKLDLNKAVIPEGIQIRSLAI